MRKSFATVLLMGLALSASAEIPVAVVDVQTLHFTLELMPHLTGNFYCDAGPTVSSVTLTSPHLTNVTVNGFNAGSISFESASKINQVLNQVYFTANYIFDGSGNPAIDIVYVGSKDDLACYQGKGNRTIEFTGQ